MKHKVFMDFDETITMSIKAFVDVYREIHKEEIKRGEIPYPIWDDVFTWNMRCEMPKLTIAEIDQIFDSERMFDNLAFYADMDGYSMQDLLAELFDIEDVDLRIASKGNPFNLLYKKLFIMQNLPFFPIENFIPMEGTIMDKSELEGLILCDDHEDNLYTANVKYKILVNFSGEIKEWNARAMQDDNIYKCCTVESLANTINTLLDFERMR